MESMLKYQCPTCTAPLRFDAEKQLLVCDFCMSEFPQDVLAGADASAAAQQQKQDVNWRMESFEKNHEVMEEQTAFICQSCAAEIISDGNTAATECLYCGNPVVLEGRVKGMLTPDKIIPFSVTKEEAMQKLKNFYEGKPLLPNAFKDSNRISKIQGLYVPFWLFSCVGDGKAQFTAKNIRSWSDDDYNYTETTTYAASRAGSIGFSSIPVDASKKMDDKYMDGIEPFDYSQAVPFASQYLAGFLADKYDVSVAECTPRIDKRVTESTVDALEDTVTGYDSVSRNDSYVTMQGEQVDYALMPVWVLSTKYEDKMYMFCVNGQTGKVAGELPIDTKKLALWRIGLTVASAIPLTLLASFFFS